MTGKTTAQITGRATADATARHARDITERQQLPPGAFRPLGRTGLTTSALGFGSYRIDAKQENHAGALRQALRRGVNLIDTSSNYSDGASETLIGRVLAELEAEFEGESEAQAEEEPGPQAEAEPTELENGEEPARDTEELEAAREGAANNSAAAAAAGALRARTILVSKGGYVQGQNMALVRRASEAGEPFAEMVEYDPACWHCIHPSFLAGQLERSLERLGVATLDVYLLHNPEYFFSDWVKRNPGADPAPARVEFYQRIGAAFRYLEQCAAEGRIQWYGVSSNTFGGAADQPDFVSLEALLAAGQAAAEAVRGAGEPSAFAVVQCPLNLLEGGPLLLPNQARGGGTFLQVAEQAGLAVLVNRPLNAIRNERLIRLADVPAPRPRVEQELQLALDTLLAEEQTFAGLFRPAILKALPDDAGPLTPFEWSGPLRRALPRMESREQWNTALENQIYPHLWEAARFVRQNLSTARNRDFSRWFPEYCRKLEAVAGMVTEQLGREEFQRAGRFHERLAPLLAEHLRGLPLSQKALLPLLALPGVSCVLNGMRRPTYVEDSTGAAALPAMEARAGEAVLRAFAEEEP